MSEIVEVFVSLSTNKFDSWLSNIHVSRDWFLPISVFLLMFCGLLSGNLLSSYGNRLFSRKTQNAQSKINEELVIFYKQESNVILEPISINLSTKTVKSTSLKNPLFSTKRSCSLVFNNEFYLYTLHTH